MGPARRRTKTRRWAARVTTTTMTATSAPEEECNTVLLISFTVLRVKWQKPHMQSHYYERTIPQTYRGNMWRLSSTICFMISTGLTFFEHSFWEQHRRGSRQGWGSGSGAQWGKKKKKKVGRG